MVSCRISKGIHTKCAPNVNVQNIGGIVSSSQGPLFKLKIR